MYGEPLTRIVAVQLDEAQSEAITKWAKRQKYNVAFVMREAALKAAKCGHLGVGFNRADTESVSTGWAEPRESTKWPLKFTVRQHDAVVAYAERIGISVRKFVLEAALAHVGAPHLGERGELDARAKALSKIGGGR